MTCANFKQMISQTQTPADVHRLVHNYFGELVAPLPDLVDVLRCAAARMEQLMEDGSEIGARGGRGVDRGDVTACAA